MELFGLVGNTVPFDPILVIKMRSVMSDKKSKRMNSGLTPQKINVKMFFSLAVILHTTYYTR